jgi:transcription antitermination factor NusG
MTEEKKWHVVYTKPHFEKKVADLLTKKGIENYSPQNKVYSQGIDRRKIIHTSLFSSFVFVRISMDELPIVKQTQGIINFIFCLNKPAIIRDKEIENIRRFLSEHGFVQLEKVDIHFNEVVKMNPAPLTEHEGKLVSIKSKTIRMVLPSLGYAMCAGVEIMNVKVIKENHAYLREPLI